MNEYEASIYQGGELKDVFRFRFCGENGHPETGKLEYIPSSGEDVWIEVGVHELNVAVPWQEWGELVSEDTRAEMLAKAIWQVKFQRPVMAEVRRVES